MGVMRVIHKGYGSYRQNSEGFHGLLKYLRVTGWVIIEASRLRVLIGVTGVIDVISPRVMGVIQVNNSHNPLVTPITLKNPAHNSHNPCAVF